MILSRKKQLLFCPGPVNIAQNIKDAAVSRDICHREKEFSQVLSRIQKKLLHVFEVKHHDLYTSVFITGSSTAANEAVLSSVVGKKKILVISNGEFGIRLFDISSLHNKKTYHLAFEWGEKIDVAQVEKVIIKHNIKIIAMVHHETSMGILNPIKEIGRLAKRHKALFIVDAVSSAGAEEIRIEECNISFLTSSSTKAFGSLPGLALVVGKREEFEKLKKIPAKTAYLDLYKYFHYAHEYLQTPNTPAVHLFHAFDQALTNILKETAVERRKTISQRAEFLRAEMKKMGLSFLKEKYASSVLTSVFLPENVQAQLFFARMKEHDIIVYNGKGAYKDKIFQVGNIGELSLSDLKTFISALRDVLDSFKQDFMNINETRVEKRVAILPSLHTKRIFSTLNIRH